MAMWVDQPMWAAGARGRRHNPENPETVTEGAASAVKKPICNLNPTPRVTPSGQYRMTTAVTTRSSVPVFSIE